MVEFEQIADSEGAKPIYQEVVGEINLQNHPSFLGRPIKVLDLAGGKGTIGVVLKQQLEASLGPLAYLRKNGLGLVLENDRNIELDKQTRDLFVTVDTGKRPGSKSFEKLKAMYDSYRLLRMRMNGVRDKQRLIDLLDKEVKDYKEWINFCEVQDRFGSW